MINRRSLVLSIAAAVASRPVLADAYPSRPIRLVVPFTPGGVTDNIGRVVGERMSRELGQSMPIDNRAGADGRIGTELVARSAPDGYTLLVGGIGPLTIHPHLVSVSYDPVNDFIPITMLAANDVVVVLNPELPPRTAAEFIAYLKENAGKTKIKYGSAGLGSPTHLATEMFARRIGVEIVHVPYKGDSAAVVDVMSGAVAFSFSTVSATISLIKAGKLRAIAAAGLTRSSALPDVPTLDESGLKGFNSDTWIGLFAPARTPDSVIARLYDATKVALSDPDVRQKLINGGNTIVGSDTREFRTFLAAESKKWAEVIRASNIKIDE